MSIQSELESSPIIARGTLKSGVEVRPIRVRRPVNEDSFRNLVPPIRARGTFNQSSRPLQTELESPQFKARCLFRTELESLPVRARGTSNQKSRSFQSKLGALSTSARGITILGAKGARIRALVPSSQSSGSLQPELWFLPARALVPSSQSSRLLESAGGTLSTSVCRRIKRAIPDCPNPT